MRNQKLRVRASSHQATYPVSLPEAHCPLSTCRHSTGKLEPRDILNYTSGGGVPAAPLTQVGPVQGRTHYPDEDFTRTGSGNRALLKFEDLGTSRSRYHCCTHVGIALS